MLKFKNLCFGSDLSCVLLHNPNRLHPDIQGTGVGVAIDKRLVENAGGKSHWKAK